MISTFNTCIISKSSKILTSAYIFTNVSVLVIIFKVTFRVEFCKIHSMLKFFGRLATLQNERETQEVFWALLLLCNLFNIVRDQQE